MSCNRRPAKPLTAKLRQPPHCDPIIDPATVPVDVLLGWANQRLEALRQPRVKTPTLDDVDRARLCAFAAWDTLAAIGLFDGWYSLASEATDCLWILQLRLRNERAEMTTLDDAGRVGT